MENAKLELKRTRGQGRSTAQTDSAARKSIGVKPKDDIDLDSVLFELAEYIESQSGRLTF